MAEQDESKGNAGAARRAASLGLYSAAALVTGGLLVAFISVVQDRLVTGPMAVAALLPLVAAPCVAIIFGWLDYKRGRGSLLLDTFTVLSLVGMCTLLVFQATGKGVEENQARHLEQLPGNAFEVTRVGRIASIRVDHSMNANPPLWEEVGMALEIALRKEADRRYLCRIADRIDPERSSRQQRPQNLDPLLQEATGQGCDIAPTESLAWEAKSTFIPHRTRVGYHYLIHRGVPVVLD